MALIKCAECGREVSDRAPNCPQCGVPIAPQQPTKTVLVLPSNKSRMTAALLAIFLGGLGAHKFYLGKPFWGIIYLVFCFTFIPAIFGFIEGLNFLLMTETTFNDRYPSEATT